MSKFHTLLTLPIAIACSVITGCASTPPTSSIADTTSMRSVETGQKA